MISIYNKHHVLKDVYVTDHHTFNVRYDLWTYNMMGITFHYYYDIVLLIKHRTIYDSIRHKYIIYHIS